MKLAALALNHVGITVPDIHAAIEWCGVEGEVTLRDAKSAVGA